jgi:hypothetical protein
VELGHALHSLSLQTGLFDGLVREELGSIGCAGITDRDSEDARYSNSAIGGVRFQPRSGHQCQLRASGISAEHGLRAPSAGDDNAHSEKRDHRRRPDFRAGNLLSLLPAILIELGVTEAWVSELESLSRFKWYFVVATVALFGYGFVLAYSRNTACGTSDCASCRPSKAIRIGLWLGVALAIAGLLFEMLEPLLASE